MELADFAIVATKIRIGPFVSLREFSPEESPGIYVIKLIAGAWSGTELEETPADDPDSIAYVGKAEGTKRTIAKRWMVEHLAAHSGRSSPRRSWLAILAPHWGIPLYPRPCRPQTDPKSSCYVSDLDGETRLREWIRAHYRVKSIPLGATSSGIDAIERHLICEFAPYANEGTPNPIWHGIIKPARRRATAEARKRENSGDLLDLDHHSRVPGGALGARPLTSR
jgi:GIY-YIG catalytic domain-containing protein